MPVYEYKGVTAQGRDVSGGLDGEGLEAVRTKLKKEGVVVLEIHEGAAGRALMDLENDNALFLQLCPDRFESLSVQPARDIPTLSGNAFIFVNRHGLQ